MIGDQLANVCGALQLAARRRGWPTRTAGWPSGRHSFAIIRSRPRSMTPTAKTTPTVKTTPTTVKLATTTPTRTKWIRWPSSHRFSACVRSKPTCCWWLRHQISTQRGHRVRDSAGGARSAAGIGGVAAGARRHPVALRRRTGATRADRSVAPLGSVPRRRRPTQSRARGNRRRGRRRCHRGMPVPEPISQAMEVDPIDPATLPSTGSAAQLSAALVAGTNCAGSRIRQARPAWLPQSRLHPGRHRIHRF